MKPHTHSETTTTFKADVKVRKYSCGFFCQRKTDSDVYDPKLGKEVNPQNKQERPPS